VTLSSVTGRVMSLAQHGKVEDALTLAEHGLAEHPGSTPTDQAGLWYAVANVELVRNATPGVLTAAERCIALAVEASDPGWTSTGLSMRALALARNGRVEPALLDLARAEAELLDCDDDGLRCWAHTGLGYTYLELRLYELAQPHLELAQQIQASPVPLPAAPVVDLMNLVVLHIRWADELERARPYDGVDSDVERHRDLGHGYAVRAVACALEVGDTTLVATCRAMELTSRPRATAKESVRELEEAFRSDTAPDYQGGRAVVGGALARALWSLGRRRQAVEVAAEAAEWAVTVSDWQVIASAQWLVVEMQAQSGVAGAAAGRTYAGLLSQVLWQQRLSTLQGAQAALQVERLRRDKELAQREASEDPLTGISNRRALNDALRDLQREPGTSPLGARVSAETPVSLLVVDLDDFKEINDTYGHVVGDNVLQAVAMTMRGVARSDDLVARLGGDEFVVLARGADAPAGVHLAERITAAINALLVGTRDGTVSLSASVGVATAVSEDEVGQLLAAADAAMYAVKAERPLDDLVPPA
jgi:diguanylate cyclase (GGDEF)-like protein